MSTYLERVRLISGKIRIKVKPNSSKTEIQDIQDNKLVINLKAPPENNKANIELIKFLTKLTKKRVRIISGFTKKQKLIEIS